MIYARHADARAAIAESEPHRMACEARDVISNYLAQIGGE